MGKVEVPLSFNQMITMSEENCVKAAVKQLKFRLGDDGNVKALATSSSFSVYALLGIPVPGTNYHIASKRFSI
jgi:hypothetical protein